MFGAALNAQTKSSMNLFPGEAQILIEENTNRNDFVIIDVCSPQEFNDRHLENAININFLSKSFKLRLAHLDKEKTYLVYCKVGGRSKFSQRSMMKLGFKRVYNLTGGTLLWEEEGLPFATGGRTHQFVFCPIFISALVAINTKKLLKASCRSLTDVIAKVGPLGGKFGLRVPILNKAHSNCCRK